MIKSFFRIITKNLCNNFVPAPKNLMLSEVFFDIIFIFFISLFFRKYVEPFIYFISFDDIFLVARLAKVASRRRSFGIRVIFPFPWPF